jgi:hypothetical protein
MHSLRYPLCAIPLKEAYDCVAGILTALVRFQTAASPSLLLPYAIPSLVTLAACNTRECSQEKRLHTAKNAFARQSVACCPGRIHALALLLQSGDTRKVNPSPQTNSPFYSSPYDVTRQVVFPFWHNINLVMVVYKLFQELYVVVNS